MLRGYIKLWRKVLDSAVFQNEGLLKVFLWCLLKANHKESFVMVKIGNGTSEVKLSPGQFLFGRESAAENLRMSPSTVWKRILKLKNLGFLNIKSDSHYSIINIVNWSSYQVRQENSDSESNSRGTAGEHRQECKNNKNNIYSQNALKVLSYLNEKTGKQYKGIKHITARLRDGATVEECRKVIDLKLADPWFIKCPQFLNSMTLFSPDNFDRYLNECLPLKTESRKSNLDCYVCPRCGAQVPHQDKTAEGCVWCDGRIAEVQA